MNKMEYDFLANIILSTSFKTLPLQAIISISKVPVLVLYWDAHIQVSNCNLFRLGKKLGLGNYIVASKFDVQDSWLPPW